MPRGRRTRALGGSWLALFWAASSLSAGVIQAPTLEWQHAGCFSSWCEAGWYSSVAVADIDDDGTPEVVGSAYSIVVLDGPTGAVEWRVASGHDASEPGASNEGRTWPGIVLADLDADGELEIATAHGGGWVSVYRADGFFEAGWPRRPSTSELRGLAADDLDRDGTLEIIVSAAVGSAQNTWIYGHDGTLRAGWPQLTGSGGFAAGIYNDNVAVGDLDGDGASELVVPSDVHYVCAYEADGSHIPAHPMYGGDNWCEVGVWEDLDIELQGWGACNGVRAESYRANFAHGPAVLGDVDGDGTLEVAAVGNVYDCQVGHPPGVYNGPYLWHADRSRFVASGYDWQSPPVDTGTPISEDYNEIESNQPNPVLADLDGDGELELLFSSYDGRVHAFWLDRTEHGNWPFSVYAGSPSPFRFASEPVVVDLDRDGSAEVIVASWIEKGTSGTGFLHVFDALGNALHEVLLPAAFGTPPSPPDWNGALPAPTLANIDADPNLEIVLNTAHSGFVAYELPGSSNARILWGTGRGSYLRSGTAHTADIFEDGFETGDVAEWSSSTL